jgi:5-(carboxyamino)imidazole ribonucleotide synthase
VTPPPSPILPGATIGILGGGQLGRMTAMAARTMGYRVHALDPDPDCSAKPVVDRLVTAKFDDADAAADLARGCDVITLEIEQIGVAALDAARAHVPVRPAGQILAVVQDRSAQKKWLRDNLFPVGAYRDVVDVDSLAEAQRALGGLFVKANRGGYDGRGQARVTGAGEVAGAWESLGMRPSVAEQALDLDYEISVRVARRPSGDVVAYEPALNYHERQVLAWSVIPAPVAAATVSRATEIAIGIAEGFAIEGLLAVEMFVTRDGELLVNELAPRPHNSYHQTEVGCATSQFEQLVRAVCDLPLGAPDVLRPAAIVNLFGDLWQGSRAPDWGAVLAVEGVRLHLYGKTDPRPGRKMGHLSATGDTPYQALQLARDAAARLGLTF